MCLSPSPVSFGTRVEVIVEHLIPSSMPCQRLAASLIMPHASLGGMPGMQTFVLAFPVRSSTQISVYVFRLIASLQQ